MEPDEYAAPDPFGIRRFLQAQDGIYAQVLQELRAGRKRTHWMWFVFPQIEGLGVSATSRHYAIKSHGETRAYMTHPVLGARLIECCEAILGHRDRSARDILGTPDDLKLRSCATLFEALAPDGAVFARILDTFFAGQRDPATLERLYALADIT